MPLIDVEGDPLLTTAQTFALGVNAQARTETISLATAVSTRFPAAFATFRKHAGAGRVGEGDLWLWRDSTPRLLFMVVRSTPFGPTRSRFVDAAALQIARDHALHGITSLAIAPLGRPEEMPVIREALGLLLPAVPIPIFVYTIYQPGVRAEEHHP